MPDNEFRLPVAEPFGRIFGGPFSENFSYTPNGGRVTGAEFALRFFGVSFANVAVTPEISGGSCHRSASRRYYRNVGDVITTVRAGALVRIIRRRNYFGNSRFDYATATAKFGQYYDLFSRSYVNER